MTETEPDPDAELTRDELVKWFAAIRIPFTKLTLTKYGSRGGGPPFKRKKNIPMYRWGDARAWAEKRQAARVKVESFRIEKALAAARGGPDRKRILCSARHVREATIRINDRFLATPPEPVSFEISMTKGAQSNPVLNGRAPAPRDVWRPGKMAPVTPSEQRWNEEIDELHQKALPLDERQAAPIAMAERLVSTISIPAVAEPCFRPVRRKSTLLALREASQKGN
jgi:hypothetical protein